MWLASEMAAFAHVAALGSFTAAARELQVPKVAVSRAIASLERRLGSRLLQRTTRRVSLTPAGTLLQPHCERLLSEVTAVRARFAAPSGTQRLQVLMDAGYGRLLVSPLVPRFLEHYPGIELQVALTDALPEAPAPSWDLWIGNGAHERPALWRTALGNAPQILCATPAYLAAHGRPRLPAELSAHAVFRALEADTPPTLRLRRGTESQELRVRPALQVNDPALVHSSAAAGLGIGVLPEFLCRQGLALGKLERVLPDWMLEQPLQLAALYAPAHAATPAIRQFLEFLLANMAPILKAPS